MVLSPAQSRYQLIWYLLRLDSHPATIGGEDSLALADHCAILEVIRFEVKHPFRVSEGRLVR